MKWFSQDACVAKNSRRASKIAAVFVFPWKGVTFNSRAVIVWQFPICVLDTAVRMQFSTLELRVGVHGNFGAYFWKQNCGYVWDLTVWITSKRIVCTLSVAGREKRLIRVFSFRWMGDRATLAPKSSRASMHVFLLYICVRELECSLKFCL